MLGGQLYYSDESKSVSGKETSDKAKSLKVAASLSFSSPYVQASASASHQNSSTTQEEKEKSNLSNAISWRAEGGDRLLCNKFVVIFHMSEWISTDLLTCRLAPPPGALQLELTIIGE